MARLLSEGMAQALRDRKPLVLLAEIEHPDGTARMWTGVGPLFWNGYVWTGTSQLGTITPIKNTSDLIIQEIKFTLVGADPEVVATLNDNVRNRSGNVWLGCLEDNGTVVPDAFQVVDATLDYQSFSASEDGTVAVTIAARTGFYTLDRALDEAWTSEEHRLEYPDDSGFDLISGLQNQTLQWTQS
ncbi:hypothetical protein [Bradyrhizobium sp. HKCCYLR20261]|uniref:hypothetical protein n=1 Tax=Bradyrhizobium sp. HKCCYLR20261 TaxID=3420760 RepID=UPI003EB8A00F